MRLCDRLEIRQGITAVIGSGGKTTLIRELAEELSEEGTVIVATSTKTYLPEYCCFLRDPDRREITRSLAVDRIVAVGSLTTTPEGRTKVSEPGIGWAELAELADYVLVEADGSRMLPLKAHESFEPVIPEGTQQTICVVGLNGIGHEIREVVHRPELFTDILNKIASIGACGKQRQRTIHDVVSAGDVAAVLRYERQVSTPKSSESGRLFDRLYLTHVDETTEGYAQVIGEAADVPVIIADAL